MHAAGSPGVRVRGLAVRFGAQPVLQGLDLEVQAGEFLVLLGPSGCGKSTLLHGIAGLVDTDDGTVEIGGRDMTFADPAERGIGMVFQSYALYPTMTVEGNLSFGLRVAGVPRAEIQRRVQRTAELLQLTPLLGRRPAQLSGGQRQRVAIGRALVREVGVYLLDEPLSNLDAQLRAELRRELKLLHQSLGATMVHVTHDQVEAMTLATRIAVMQGGAIQQVGTPQEVYERPATRFVAGFLGAPAMNFIEGRLLPRDAGWRFEAEALVLDLPAETLEAPGAARPAVLGLRPEHLQVAADGPLAATVQLVEPLGGQQVLWLRSGPHALAVQQLQPAGPAPAPGAVLRLHVDAGRASLFDPATGARL